MDGSQQVASKNDGCENWHHQNFLEPQILPELMAPIPPMTAVILSHFD